MPKAKWDELGKKQYDIGVDQVVLYKYDKTSSKWVGVPWSGIISITDKPTGAEETKLWADNIQYGSLRSAEEFEGTIEAYMWPDEFETCDGFAGLDDTGAAALIKVGQQPREPFCLFYRNKIGNDQNSEAGYRYHIVYNATCSPSEKAHNTVNDNPDVETFSWDFTTTPVAVPGKKPTAHISFDSTDFNTTTLEETLEEILDVFYGHDADSTASPAITDAAPEMLLPEDLLDLLAG